MAMSLLEMVRQRTSAPTSNSTVDPSQVKTDSEAFQKRYAPDTDAPQERGLQEASFIPTDPQEMAPTQYRGWDRQAVPFGPATETAPPGKLSKGLLQKIRDAGWPDQKIDEAAESMRVHGSHTFVGEGGKPIMTVGDKDALGQELLAHGRGVRAAAAEQAPSIDYSTLNEPLGTAAAATGQSKMSGEAEEFFKRTGVNPTRKSAIQAMQELRAKGK